VLDGILAGIIDASLLRKAMQSCSGVDIWRRVDFFANVRVVDRFPFGEIFLRTPCAEVMAAPGEVAMSATRVHVGLMMESRFPIRNVTAQYLRL
jgi:hypothetical protein